MEALPTCAHTPTFVAGRLAPRMAESGRHAPLVDGPPALRRRGVIRFPFRFDGFRLYGFCGQPSSVSSFSVLHL